MGRVHKKSRGTNSRTPEPTRTGSQIHKRRWRWEQTGSIGTWVECQQETKEDWVQRTTIYNNELGMWSVWLRFLMSVWRYYFYIHFLVMSTHYFNDTFSLLYKLYMIVHHGHMKRGSHEDFTLPKWSWWHPTNQPQPLALREKWQRGGYRGRLAFSRLF